VTLTGFSGLVMIILFLGTMIAFYLIKRESKETQLRPIEGYRTLKREIGHAVESGSQLHVSLGWGGITGPKSAAALAGLSMLQQIIQESAVCDHPPLSSTGDAAISILAQDTIQVQAEALGSDEPLTVYRARKAGEPVAAILTVVAPNGYNGSIRLLVGIRRGGSLAGVRVLSHKETPGLGDAVEAQRSDWLEQFPGRALGDPPLEDWKVKRDGGAFDQLTGATVTPRAIVQAVRRALVYFDEHKQALFRRKAPSAEGGVDG